MKFCDDAYTCDPTIWEVATRGSGIQGPIQLHSKFQASLDDMRPYFIKGRVGNEGGRLKDPLLP